LGCQLLLTPSGEVPQRQNHEFIILASIHADPASVMALQRKKCRRNAEEKEAEDHYSFSIVAHPQG
jgi:hypothetical protein